MKLTAVPTEIVPVFFCPVCHLAYSEQQEAVACAASTPEPDLAEGDILIWDSGHTWIGKDPGCDDFVLDKKSRTQRHGQDTAFRVLVVVASVTTNKDSGDLPFRGHWGGHDLRYTIANGAFFGVPSLSYVTRSHKMYDMRKPEPGEVSDEKLAKVLSRTKHLMGIKSNYLL